MKRRKRIWIACAALAVVVALCAATLLYRPVPYQFLEGSRYAGSYVVLSDTYRCYGVRGTVDTVFGKALTELTPAARWGSRRFSDGAYLTKAGQDIHIDENAPDFLTERGRPPDAAGTVWVSIRVKPTPFDRFLRWVRNR